MAITVGEVLAKIDRSAPFRTAAEWDSVGLQLGDPNRSITRAAVVHELTDSMVQQVLARKVELVLTYHPLIFRPLRSVTAVAGPEGRCFALIRAEVSVISVHTNWDVAAGGTSDSLAEALRVEDTEGFAEVEAAGDEPVWIGRHGHFGGSSIDLLRTVEAALETCPRVAGLGTGRVRRVAVLPGSGGAHLDEALSAGAEVYVTGDLTHHQARRAVDHRMAVIDAGHAPSERPGLRALHSLVAGIVPGALDLARVDNNPWEA